MTTYSGRKVTLKQRKWLKLYLETGNATQSALEVYDCKSIESAKVIGHENLTKLNFIDLMEEHGLSDNQLLQMLKSGLGANHHMKVQTVKRQLNNGYAITTNLMEFPDYHARCKYLDMAFRLRGRFIQHIAMISKKYDA